LSLIVLPLLAYGLGGTAEAAAAPFTYSAPGGTGGWHGPVLSEQRFVYEGSSGGSVELTALASSVQGSGKELSNILASVAGTDDPTLQGSRTVTVDGLPYTETVTTDPKGRPLLLWSTYDIGGRRFVRPLLSRLWYGIASLGGAERPVLFAFWTSCNASCDAARRTLTDFAKTVGPQLSHPLGRVSQSPSNQRAL
jgi:hypothetical protein